ncbi:alpha/beta hydrolase, partial [Xanthomonas campestris pv. nigromaculans]|nr:alpha/beta hydrolase [Xanthomonas campestris pv. nigromaculans]
LGGPIDQWLAQVHQDPSHCPAPQALPASTLAVANPLAMPQS